MKRTMGTGYAGADNPGELSYIPHSSSHYNNEARLPAVSESVWSSASGIDITKLGVHHWKLCMFAMNYIAF